MPKYKYKYWDMYEQYPEAVIIIPFKYMYRGFENSARVLSYLLENKLQHNTNGLISASPDIDGILAALENNHVNYIFLEHGEIAASNTFEDNTFNRYLELSKGLPVWYYNSATRKYDIADTE